MNVTIYNNSKRLNSTRVAGSGIGSYDCVLKDACSLLQPSLRIKSSTKPDGNYIYFEGRYYWITDKVSVANDLWQITGKVDVLTTYRSHILNTTAFVLYDSTPNTQLPDNRLGIQTDAKTFTSTASMPWQFASDTNSGTYLIATTGDKDIFDLDLSGYYQANQRNGTGVYAIPYTSIENLGFDLYDFLVSVQTMWNDLVADETRIGQSLNPARPGYPQTIEGIVGLFMSSAFETAVNITTEYPTRLALLVLQNILGGGNALQNIKASYWLPFVVPDAALNGILHTSDKLALGTYTDTVPGLKRVSDPVITSINIPVSIPWQFHDWRDVTCSELMLYIPLIGCISIPTEVVKGQDELKLKFSLNLYSGDLACEVLCNGGQIGTYGASAAMNILIGDSNINMSSLGNTIVAAATKHYAAAAAGAMETLSGMSTSVGGIGGGAGVGLTNEITCIIRTHETSQDPAVLRPIIGTPTRELKALSTALGYVQCLNAQVNLAGGAPYPTQTEIEEINNFLNTGVYLE